MKKSIEKSDIMTLRDIKTLETVKLMKVENENIFLTTDPVFSLKPDDNAQALLKENNIPCDKEFV